MIKVLIYLINFITMFIIGVMGMQAYKLVTSKEYYGFPAVTQCRICNKTVWEFQKYEYRNFTIEDNLPIEVTAGGIVHKRCKGNPAFKIEVIIK